jgi:hypothetical protein
MTYIVPQTLNEIYHNNFYIKILLLWKKIYEVKM